MFQNPFELFSRNDLNKNMNFLYLTGKHIHRRFVYHTNSAVYFYHFESFVVQKHFPANELLLIEMVVVWFTEAH